MSHNLVLSRVCVACDHKQPTGPICSNCGGTDFDFKYLLMEVKRPIDKERSQPGPSRQITLFDD